MDIFHYQVLQCQVLILTEPVPVLACANTKQRLTDGL